MMKNNDFRLETYREEALSDAQHARIDALLLTCFGADAQEWMENRARWPLPQSRWLAYATNGAAENGDLAGHIAVYEKQFGIENSNGESADSESADSESADLSCLGIGWVAVHPDYRGRGLVRTLLSAIHDDGAARGYEYSTLFGNPAVYGSSGYQNVRNAVRFLDHKSGQPQSEIMDYFLVTPLRGEATTPWPSGEIDLRGMKF